MSLRRARTSAILAEGDELLVFAPFEARETLKGLPVRRWDPHRKCWVVPTELRRSLLDVLRTFGPVDDQSDGTAWLRGMFAAVPERHRDRVYRALASAFHPDVGGSHAMMVALNRWHEESRR